MYDINTTYWWKLIDNMIIVYFEGKIRMKYIKLETGTFKTLKVWKYLISISYALILSISYYGKIEQHFDWNCSTDGWIWIRGMFK